MQWLKSPFTNEYHGFLAAGEYSYTNPKLLEVQISNNRFRGRGRCDLVDMFGDRK